MTEMNKDLNIISNNSIASRIYLELGLDYNNPFAWSYINFRGMNELIRNYYDIDFLNFRVSHGDDGTHKVWIDRKFCCHYIHYIHKGSVEMMHEEVNVVNDERIVNYIGNLMSDFVSSVYESRTRIMLKEHIDPIFIIARDELLSLDEFQSLIELPCKYKRIFFVPTGAEGATDVKLPDGVEIIPGAEKCNTTTASAKLILKESKLLSI